MSVCDTVCENAQCLLLTREYIESAQYLNTPKAAVMCTPTDIQEEEVGLGLSPTGSLEKIKKQGRLHWIVFRNILKLILECVVILLCTSRWSHELPQLPSVQHKQDVFYPQGL